LGDILTGDTTPDRTTKPVDSNFFIKNLLNSRIYGLGCSPGAGTDPAVGNSGRGMCPPGLTVYGISIRADYTIDQDEGFPGVVLLRTE
jgi:hypothetical protein